MLDVPLPNHGTSHFVFNGQPAVSPTPPPVVPAQLSGSQQSEASTQYDFEDYDINLLTQLAYQERINILTAELDDTRKERNALQEQVSILILHIDGGTVSPSITPKTPARKAVAQGTLTPGLDDRNRSPFPLSPSRIPAQEPTTSISREPSLTQAAHVASPSSCHGIVSPSRARVYSPASTSSTATRTVGADSLIDYILRYHGVRHLKAKVLLILSILSDPCEVETLAQELETIGLPKAAISNILKASILHKIQ